jgi:Carbamoyl-phosphate synthase L chain, ATP binding domain
LKTALLLGNYRPTFILARSLKLRGYDVVCGLDGFDRGAEVSKHVDTVWQHSSYITQVSSFQQELNQLLASRPDISAVYPVAEPVIRAFADGRLVLPKSIKLGSVAGELVLRCLDKQGLLAKAKEMSVPVAPNAETSGKEHFYVSAEEIGFPLVVRPLQSGKLLEGQKAITVDDMDALRDLENVWNSCDYRLLIQRHVPGLRENIYFAAQGGDIYRYLHAKITRTDQPDGSGLAIEGETVAPCSVLKHHTEVLVRALNYTGIGCAQFLVDTQTGDISFLELNPRIAGNHAVPEACNLALGDCLIDMTEGRNHPAPYIEGIVGLKYGWIAGELESVKKTWQAGRLSFWQALFAVYKSFSYFRSSHMDVGFAKDDPLPGLFTLCDSLPLVGGITRLRLERPYFFKYVLRKECL